MYEVQITNRGPEGVRGYTKFRTTKEGSDELLKRMEKKVASGEILNGIERDEEDASQQRGKRKSKETPAAE